MKENRGRYTIGEMAGCFGVSCSAYYRWVRYGVSERRCSADAELIFLIREIQSTHRRRYGSPRVREELREAGKPEESGPVDEGTGVKRSLEREVHPRRRSRAYGDLHEPPAAGRTDLQSDRGVQYYAESFRARLQECRPTVRRSMRREGKRLGQRLRRIFFQNAEEGVGSIGRQTFGGGGQAISVHVP
jgi:hypothetical protein